MDPVTLKGKPCHTAELKRMKTSHLPRSKNLPWVVLIKQHFPVPKVADVREATVRELKKAISRYDRDQRKDRRFDLSEPRHL
jgi:hypothetical protein